MTEQDNMFILMYEENLLSPSNKNAFNKLDDKLKKACFIAVWRYALEEMQGWTPEQSLKYLNTEVLEKLKLDKTLMLIGETGNYCMNNAKFLSIVYPGIIKYNLAEETLDIYKRVIKGEIFKGKAGIKIPPAFWTDNDGKKRAIIILSHLLNNYLSDMTIEDKYVFFGSAKRCNSFFQKWHIKSAMTKNFNSALDFFQEAVDYMHQASGFLYWNERIKLN